MVHAFSWCSWRIAGTQHIWSSNISTKLLVEIAFEVHPAVYWRANSAHIGQSRPDDIGQSRPDSGQGFQFKDLKTSCLFSLRSKAAARNRRSKISRSDAASVTVLKNYCDWAKTLECLLKTKVFQHPCQNLRHAIPTPRAHLSSYHAQSII